MPQQHIYAANERFAEPIEYNEENFESECLKLPSECSPSMTFEGWTSVPAEYKSKQDWLSRGFTIPSGKKPAASVKVVATRRTESIDKEYLVEKFHSLYHQSQTRAARKTELSEARQSFFTRFAEPADWRRLIKWTEGEWTGAFGNEQGDDAVENCGWLTYKEKLTLPKLINHELGREIYGVFGGRDSYHLLIDVDLHNQPLSLFETRLRILVDRFHGQHRCHFQVANTNAGGVHLILFFGTPGLLSTRRKWLLNELEKLDQAYRGALLTKQTSRGLAFNIEVFPDPKKACRLPLARERTMLLDKPLQMVERRSKSYQDVIGYMRWLDQAPDLIRYMPKDEVIKFITERLNLSTAKGAVPTVKATARKSKAERQPPKAPGATVEKVSMKGRTKSAITSYWRDGQPAFSHLNSAIRTTLQALHAEGASQIDSEAFVLRLASDIPNKQLSSRLVGGLELIKKEVARQSKLTWDNEPSEKWKRAVEHWSSYGFRVSDISTWDRTQEIDQVVVDCDEIDFNQDEKQSIIKLIAPIVVGAKQANKQDKQAEVISATAYFLRYVKCCPREIPVTAVPQILSKFKIKMKKKCKSSSFVQLLVEMNWIYIKTEYLCPKLLSGGRSTERGRARSYGIGAAIAGKFHSSKQEKNNNNNKDLYTAFPFLGTVDLDSKTEKSNLDELVCDASIRASRGWYSPIA